MQNLQLTKYKKSLLEASYGTSETFKLELFMNTAQKLKFSIMDFLIFCAVKKVNGS